MRAYRLGEVSLIFDRRGLRLRTDDGTEMRTAWQPEGCDLLWSAPQQCQCSTGNLDCLALDGNRAILACSTCSNQQHYLASLSVMEMAYVAANRRA